MARIRLGDLLVKAGLIDELQLQSALAHQRQWGGKLGDILVNNGFLDEMMLWRGLSKQLAVPLVSLPELQIVQGLEKQVPVDLCQKHSIFPIHRDDKGLTLATSDPGNIGGIDEVAFRLGVRLKLVLAPDREVEWAIRRYHMNDPAPCPPPRLRRVMEPASAPPASAPPQMVIEHSRDITTPMAELAQMAQRAQAAAQQAQQATQPPMSTSPWPSPQPTQPWTSQPSPPSPATWAPPPSPATWAPQPTQPPSPPPTPWTSPQNAPSEAELMIRETAHLLRFLVEACIQRGVFTRDDYLRKLKSL